jgi:hypothetical protein
MIQGTCLSYFTAKCGHFQGLTLLTDDPTNEGKPFLLNLEFQEIRFHNQNAQSGKSRRIRRWTDTLLLQGCNVPASSKKLLTRNKSMA